MNELALTLLVTVLVNNLVLTKFLGLCPFLGVSKKLETAVAMSLATMFVLTLAAALSHALHALVLVPAGLGYLRIIAFILVIAVVVQFTEMMVAKMSPLMHQVLGIYLPLITTNCVILGVVLLNTQASRTFVEAIVYGLGAGLGFALVLVLFSALRERLEVADVPAAFRGAAIALITAGLMSLAFMGFAGLGGLVE